MEMGDLLLDEQEKEPKIDWLGRLTVADGVMVLLLLATAVIRLANLGHIPLAESEAELALSVWRFSQSADGPLWLHSPAYFSLTAVLSQLFGFGDGVVRLLPALFGVGLVYLPWLLRHRLGAVGALTACTLLAVSPLQTLLARTAGGDSLAVFALLLLLVAFVRYQETAVPFWLNWLFVGLGLGLVSSPLFYTGLVSVVLGLFVLAKMGLRLVDGPGYVRPNKEELATAVAWGGGLFVLLGSCFFLLPTGFGGTAQIFADWLAQFGSNGRWLADPFIALVRYEPILLVWGVAALVWALWRPDALNLALVYWLLASLLFLLLQSGQMNNAALLTVPAYLLIGGLLNYVLSGQRLNLVSWASFAGLLLLAATVIINVGRLVRVVSSLSTLQGNSVYMIYIHVVVLVLFLALVLFYLLMTMDATAVVQGIALGTVALFLLIHWGNSWWMGQQAANDPRERWVLTATDSNFRLLLQSLHDFSYQFNRGTNDLDVATNIDTAVMHWYLRDFKKAQIGTAVSALASNSVLITSTESQLQLEQAYTGADYRLTVSKDSSVPAEALTGDGLLKTLRWWFFHDGSAPLRYERVVLWVHADKFQQNE